MTGAGRGRAGSSLVSALVLLLAAGTVACGSDEGADGGRGAAITRFEVADGPSYAVVRAGASLVGVRRGSGISTHALVRSDDGGRTWTEVALPGAPAEVDLADPVLAADVVVVRGRAMEPPPWDPNQLAPSGAAFVWTTTDGERWAGGELAADAPPFTYVGVHAIGDVLVAGLTVAPPAHFALHLSTDRGATWHETAAPDLGLRSQPGGDPDTVEIAQADAAWELDGRWYVLVGFTGYESRLPPELLASDDRGATWHLEPCDTPCGAPVRGAGLLVVDGQTSTDGGRTWAPMVVEPPLEQPVEEIVGKPGGWLATGTTHVPSDVSYGHLLRSRDGRRWERLLEPDPCQELGGTRPNSAYHRPLLFEGRWYVAYSCLALSTPTRSDVFTADEALESAPVPLDGTRRDDVAYGDPLAFGDLVLVPEYGGEQGTLVGFTAIRAAGSG